MPLPQVPVASPFGPFSTTAEIARGVDLHGRNVIVTGATAGLGAETARCFAAAGARVTLAVRDVHRGKEVASAIRASSGNDRVDVALVDLARWETVRRFAEVRLAEGQPLHILINNAGCMPAELQLIEHGIEMQFGANHLAHMLLAGLLAPLLRKGSPSRLVVLSSAAHRRLPIDFTDDDFLGRPYEKLEAYSIAKTANALFALEFNRRLEPAGITAFSVNPGPVFTGIQQAFSPAEMQALKFHDAEGNRAAWFKPIEVGAATTVWCALSPLLTAGGVYCEDCNVAPLRGIDHDELNGVRPWAADPEAAQRLWAISERLLGQPLPRD